MKIIDSCMIEEVSYKLLKYASWELPPEVERAIQNAYAKETTPLAKTYWKAMLQNIIIAREKRVPLCQDTGIPIYYMTLGSGVHVKGGIREAINRATQRATRDVPLREQVTHPLTREVSKTNVGWGLPTIYLDYENNGEEIEILAVPRGGGGEAKFQCVIPYPSADRKKGIVKIVLDAVSMARGESCTPNIIGVGIGGYGREQTCLMSRRALFRTPLNSRHQNPEVAEMEDIIYREVNRLGIGPLGIGGDTTCLAVHMDVGGAHTAGWTVAVSFSCWVSRYSKAKIMSNKKVEYLTHPNIV